MSSVSRALLRRARSRLRRSEARLRRRLPAALGGALDGVALVRRLGPADLPRWQAFTGGRPAPSTAWPPAETIWLGAFVGSELVATAHVGRPWQHIEAVFLSALYVAPASRRRGLGRLLIAAAVDAAANAGHRELHANVAVLNQASLQAFATAGFSFVSPGPLRVSVAQALGPERDERLLVRGLRPTNG